MCAASYVTVDEKEDSTCGERSWQLDASWI